MNEQEYTSELWKRLSVLVRDKALELGLIDSTEGGSLEQGPPFMFTYLVHIILDRCTVGFMPRSGMSGSSERVLDQDILKGRNIEGSAKRMKMDPSKFQRLMECTWDVMTSSDVFAEPQVLEFGHHDRYRFVRISGRSALSITPLPALNK